MSEASPEADPQRERSALDKLNRLGESSGHLPRGVGMVSGVIAFCLAVLSLLAVIGFHFPAYLSTPEFRAHYDVTTLRYMLFAAMLLAGTISIANMILGRVRWLSAIAFGILVVSELLGGPSTPIGEIRDHTPYLGLDFFVLDLMGSTLLFVFLEKMMPLRAQPVFRPAWQGDLTHFFVNHLIVGFVLLATNRIVHTLFGWAVIPAVQSMIESMPFLVQLFGVVLAADLVQYWTHRAYHEIPFLWRFHSVHHSAEHMDWLAGSRQHILELIATRVMVLAPIFVLGFSQQVIDVYVIIVGFQAVFNHCNVSVRLGPLRYVLVTPNFHHWHHSRDTEAIDKNYAAHFAFLDYLFGTAVTADRKWPNRYGVVGDYVPVGFTKQQAFPFVGSTKSRERSTKPPEADAWEKSAS
jgi:sterol desaturase/sphingolipid hydroxylase (fatty acid hydroxylase superfamily)